MSVRAVILGLLGGAFIAAACFVNDRYAGTDVLVGHHLPVSVFGMLVVAGMAINPLLYAMRPSWRLSSSELITVLVLVLVACSVPGMSLGQNFAPVLAMPAQHNLVNPGWRKYNVLGYAPAAMLPAGGMYDRQVLEGYLSGSRGTSFGLNDVPWAKWQQPLETWTLLASLLAVATICLSLIVHKQWSDHERLRYPIAEVAAALTGQEPNRAVGPLFRERSFWVAFGIILAVRLWNGLNVWFPAVPDIPLRLNFGAVAAAFPTLAGVPGVKYVLGPTLYPAAVGFAFFLAGDVSLSIGLAVYLHFAVMVVLLKTDVAMQDDLFSGGAFVWQRFGSCLGIALVLAKTGRRYYGQVLKAAFGAGGGDRIEPYAAWACRFLLLAMAGAVGLLTSLGLDWPLAILLVLLIMLFFLVAARFSAEAGLFFITSLWQPAAVLMGLLGGFALGPKALVIIGLVTMVLAFDPRESLMPFMVNALKLGQGAGLRPSRIGPAAVGVYLMALAVALPTTLWVSYKLGAGSAKRYETENKTWAALTFNATERVMTQLKNGNQLQTSLDLDGLERLTNGQPSKVFLTSAGLGLAAVLAFSLLRLRFTWWPIHPIMFCVWGTQSMKALSASFLIGWAIKGLLARIGFLTGGRLARIKTVMIGLIAADLVAGVIFMAIGAIFYALTGRTPPEYYIFPH
jgi:hypothetical protein